ncbi:putative TAM domain methyltransferase [Ascobolus immersus RN42]|uniref:Putative TAM domain methyltransferase n=1 Tax=Ascobolus immersus RN42 TaxID=1160509 RepID=A0A3N4HXS1_ASCIM|nr:putative TAM domain methyltransferase [Ascobolus immersus RN42]
MSTDPHLYETPSPSTETIAISESYDSGFEEIDDDVDMHSIADSGFNSIDAVTVASSIYDYQYENGRRFHSYRSGTYAQPDDNEEQDRLNLYHHVWLLMLRGNLFCAPINPSTCKTVLDLGTGTGIWAMDFAGHFENASVLGVDLSPIQPLYTPPNVTFLVDDVEEYPWSWIGWDWGFEGGEFDYIHCRNLAGSIRDWEAFITEIWNHTAPGGWVEFGESDCWLYSEDDSYSRAPNLKRYMECLIEATNISGASLDIWRQIEPALRKLGFVDIQKQKLKVPWSPWPKDPHYKEIGKYSKITNESGLASYGVARFKRFLNMPDDEFQELVSNARAELVDKSAHLLTDSWKIWARKPEVPDYGRFERMSIDSRR